VDEENGGWLKALSISSGGWQLTEGHAWATTAVTREWLGGACGGGSPGTVAVCQASHKPRKQSTMVGAFKYLDG
jgi:hypothetical protein